MNNPSTTSNATSTKPKSKSSAWANAGIQRIKRARADAFIGAHPDFSDRTLARLAGVSHTFIAMRRGKFATGPQGSSWQF